jgi:hypothetical protein
MMQVWLYNLPNVTPTLIVGLTFDEIKQLLENPLNIHLRASPSPAETAASDETHVPVPICFVQVAGHGGHPSERLAKIKYTSCER